MPPRKKRGTRKKEPDDPVSMLARELAASDAQKNDGKKTGEECKFTDHGELGTLETRSIYIKTPEQALAKANIDTSLWEIERQLVNSWEIAAYAGDGEWSVQPLWQVKLHLKRKVAKRYADGIDWIADRLAKRPLRLAKAPKVCGDVMFEPSIYDAQMGRYAWGEETGQDVDVERATAVYANAVQDFCHRLRGWNVSRITMPIGHDLFEVDNWSNTTEHGTPQDVDTRFPRVFGMVYCAVERAVIELRKIAPVECIYIPGNHDPATSYYLCHSLKQRFQNVDDVTIDISPKSRKYVQWGVNLIGMTHGNMEKRRDLPTIMAGEVPDLWAATKFREWHTGHNHTAKTTVHQTADEFGGVRVRILPSIAAANRWSFQMGYSNARQAAEGYLWDKREGYVGHFSVNAREN
jgi:hypothetical protein